ncbi:hypothetical protein V6N13_055712 [Hibiscus sabdariffa]|uniref:Zer-1-like leucine-rich repeats region domain-containing protein n=1 Tax=Hibiscus sabdariffa TaxID=183260 RepID=A0ABR2BMP5_9ROSI
MLFGDKVDSVSLPDALSYFRWDYYPFKSLPPSFNPKKLAMLNLWYGCIEQLWNEDHQDLTNLRVIDLYICPKLRKILNLSGAINLQRISCRVCESLVELPCLSHLTSLKRLDLSDCNNLRKIPSLLGAFNLQSLNCYGCESLVELPSLGHLTSLKRLDLSFCENLKKIPKLLGAVNLKSLECRGCISLVELPELPNSIVELHLSHTQIEEVVDSIQHLVGLEKLNLSRSRVKNVSSNIANLESLCELDVSACKSLQTLSELPQYLRVLDANDCTSLEKVSFTDHSFNSFHSLHDGNGASGRENVFMLFYNCRSLNQDSIKNIVVNAMLQIHSLAQRLMSTKGISGEQSEWHSLFCCVPGNEVPANVFYGSMNCSLNLKITQNGFSRNRFLAFAICLLPHFTNRGGVLFMCKYQLTTSSGEKFTREFSFSEGQHKVRSYNDEIVLTDGVHSYKGDHVLILFNQDMIIIDNDYEEASFEFYMGNIVSDEFRVEKCGVNIFYLDAESYTISDAEWRCANIEEAHDH